MIYLKKTDQLNFATVIESNHSSVLILVVSAISPGLGGIYE